MLNFLKDVYLEVNGCDIQKVKQERMQKEEKKRADKIVLSKGSKHVIRGFGILYIVIGLISLTTYFNNKEWLEVVEYGFMLLFDILIIIFISLKKKETEVAGIICSGVFIILNMILPLL